LYGATLYGGVYGSSGTLVGFTAYLQAVPADDVVGIPTIYAPSNLRLITEFAPLRLSMNILTPDGYQTRWSSSETNPLKTHQGLTFSTTLPGGFEHCDVTLIRDPRRFYHDLRELQRITIYGVGGSVAWQGRLETIPSVSGDQLSFTPGASGYQSALTDDNSARELYIENDLTKWQSPMLNRMTVAAYNHWDLEGSLVSPNPFDPVNPFIPSLVCQFQGPWTRLHVSEAWYDTQGLPIGYILWQANVAATNTLASGVTDATINGSAWVASLGVCSDDAIATTSDGGATWVNDSSGSSGQYDSTSSILGSLVSAQSASGQLNPTTNNRVYAFVQLYNSAATGTDGVMYSIFWRVLTIVGQQGLPLYTSDLSASGPGGTGPMHAVVQGVLGSDVLKHALPKYAPEIAITKQGISTIQASSFVIPEVVFLNPGTVADIINGVSAYELNDWGVYEGDHGNPCFFWAPRNSIGRRWRSRMGPAKLQSTGPQIDRLFNGVIVSFTDFAGIARTVGPGGSGVPAWAQSTCTYTDPSLIDLDPQNPLNQWGDNMRKWAPLTMNSTSTLPQAIAIGVAFLQEQKLRNSSGSAQLSGYVEDDTGVIWPAYMVRAGDQIAFVDAAIPDYRRIVSTSYNDDSRVNSITLDSPPDSLQAILSRLQVDLVPISGG